MYHWVKPQIAIPVHGEDLHLKAHADIARQCGINKHYVGRNGDLYRLAPQPSIRRQVVTTGRIPLEQG
jgi:ribonuclease J